MPTPLWVRNVISLCNAQGGKITAEEIANIAATVKTFALGSSLVSRLKNMQEIQVVVVGKTWGANKRKVLQYRIIRRDPAAEPPPPGR